MINLLTLSEKKKIKQDYIIRLVIIALAMLFLIVLLAIAFLLPSYLLSSVKENIVNTNLLTLRLNQDFQDNKRVSDIIEDTNNKLSILSGFGKKTLLSEDMIEPLLEKALGIVEIKEISFQQAEGNIDHIELRGTAATRESLISFVESIDKLDRFESVDLPVSALVKNKDIDFSIKISRI